MQGLAGVDRVAQRAEARPRRARRPSPLSPTPIVKWAGGKTRLLSALASRAPASFRRYFEPFAGGAALFFHLAPRSAVLSDLNADLIGTYHSVAWHVESVIRRLRHHRLRHEADYYYAMRERWNARDERDSALDRAALFIYLNKTCYNGLWRVNRRGAYNVPIGRYTDPPVCDAPGLRAASRLLQRAELCAGTYRDAVASVAAGDFVYFDPPYHPLSPTASFTSYTSASFAASDQEELASAARELSDRGATVMLSNSDTPLIRELYRDWQIDEVRCSRAINSRGGSRGKVGEVVITRPRRG